MTGIVTPAKRVRAERPMLDRGTERAAPLFISPSTVHDHPSKVFRKLGITGRGQLAHRLP